MLWRIIHPKVPRGTISRGDSALEAIAVLCTERFFKAYKLTEGLKDATAEPLTLECLECMMIEKRGAKQAMFIAVPLASSTPIL